MLTLLTEKNIKKHPNFVCDFCDFKCCKKGDYKRHLLTRKHSNNEKNSLLLTFVDKKTSKNITCTCQCGKIYKTRQGLYLHKKKCIFIENENDENDKNNENDENDEHNELCEISEIDKNDNSYKEMFMSLINENKELRKMMQEQQKQIFEIIPKIGNNNTTNNNQNFNINVFLNEKCKDAVNMSDFIKSIEVSVDQLDYTKNKGLAAGLSNAIIENMNKLGIYERPIHCTDIKRETIYVKDNDVWDKESSKDKIKYAINKTSGKNYNALQNWKKENPDYNENDAKQDYFAHTLSTIGRPTVGVAEKIIKKICSETYIKDSISNNK